jgi:hypothetical protein
LTLTEIISYIQLSANAFALGVAGWIYAAYVKNLNAALSAKDEQIKVVEKTFAFWKDKVQDLEKKTPEHMEEVLSKRIKTREDEIKRLLEDKEAHQKELQLKTQELNRLKSDLEKTIDVRRNIDLLTLDLDEDKPIRDSDLEIEEMGFVCVDSGQLMITDPCYIDSEWQEEKLEVLRLYKDIETSEVYQFGKDFSNFDEIINGYSESINELCASGRFEAIEIKRDYTFSYAGACYATLSKLGFGQLKFRMGHNGAGIAVHTVAGDGIYPVYAEKYNGDIVRVYVNLI